jgi:hypothetical protein
MGEVTLVGVGAAADEDVRAGVLLARVLELSRADEAALLGEILLDDVIVGTGEDDAALLADTEVAATDEGAVTPAEDRPEDKTPHFPNPF